MLRFERTEDPVVVREIIAHPKLYRWFSDDSCPPREEFQPTIHPLIWYVLVFADAECIGLFMFVAENGACLQVHTCLLPTAWGKYSVQAAREVADWIWQNTPYQRIITHVPRYNRLAAKLAEQAGMELFGVNPRSYPKNGKRHDQLLFGLSRKP